MAYFPKFTLKPEVANYLVSITEKVTSANLIHDIPDTAHGELNLYLRKVNRIRSIQSSTAIEGNTLSLEQVTDVINGRPVKGNEREIKEVQNAYAAYEAALRLDPYQVANFLDIHKIMTQGLVGESGVFRTRQVGVFAGKQLIHQGSHPAAVAGEISDLLAWAKSTDLHPLIKAAIVHFEIEYIHPFADGNGRMGRLWQTIILAQWKPLFAWLPVETMIHAHQYKYYEVLQNAEKTVDATEFIIFILQALQQSLDEWLAAHPQDIAEK